jgi:transcriptional regulator with XRE-family HTH domain
MTVLQQLGKRIVYLRQQKGWSQLDLSLEAGINRNYLSDLERGKRNPTVMILQKIALALTVDLATLFKGIIPIEAISFP